MGQIGSWGECFDRKAQYYDDPRLKMGYGNQGTPVPHSVMTRTIKDVWQKLAPEEDSKMLDVGAGAGLFCEAFRSRVENLVGVDISRFMIADAKQMSPDGSFAVCRAGDLPFRGGSFDRVLCYSVFHYLSQCVARRTIWEFLRVVTGGGVVLIGDVPMSMKSDSRLTDGVPYEHPEYLEHNLKHTTYSPGFFYACGDFLGCDVTICEQDIEGKETAGYRFDVLINA